LPGSVGANSFANAAGQALDLCRLEDFSRMNSLLQRVLRLAQVLRCCPVL
jgi:hypothetical protein